MSSLAIDTTRRPLRLLAALGTLVCLLFSSGCDLIWEPPDDAVDRLLSATVERDMIEIDEMIEDETLRRKFKALGASFGSTLYKGRTKYWKVVNIEEVEEEDITYVDVDIEVPRAPGKEAKTRTVPVAFEMRRDMFNWEVLDIIGIDDLTSTIDRSRGLGRKTRRGR